MQQFNKKENAKSREERLKELDDGDKVSTSPVEMQLLEVDSEEYKKRRDAALQETWSSRRTIYN
jgi:hypothetical protein